ncbi:putative zinc metalloprotease YwhC [Rhodospirillaceae bacterium LM-1]|nr:putative zinc metalloprotease YwhC [Rhodospirillaceae bacterium LM-1]
MPEDFSWLQVLAVTAWIIPVLLAVTLHEAAHGYAAWKLGDETAMRLGRVTFNPLRHIDPFGTVLLPGILLLTSAPVLFGYAKPVPVNPYNLRNPRLGMVLVAAAGPGINLALALFSVLFLGRLVDVEVSEDWVLPVRWLGANLYNSIEINALLAVFNLLPLLPLDGGRILAGLLPTALGIRFARTERAGLLILLGVLFILPLLGQVLGFHVNILGPLVGEPAAWLVEQLVGLTGLQ